MKLAHRIALIVMVGLTPIIGIEIYNSVALFEARQQEVQQMALRQAQLASSELSRIVGGFRGIMLAVGEASSVRAFNSELCSQFVGQLTNKIKYLSIITVADGNGQIRCAPLPEQLNINISDKAYFQQSLLKDDLVIGEYTQDSITKKPALPLAFPIANADGKHIGAVITSVDPQWLSQQFLLRGLPIDGTVTVADRSGTIIARQPDPDKFVGTRIPDQYMHLVTAPESSVISGKGLDGVQRLLGYVPVSSSPLGLYVSAGFSINQSFLSLTTATWRQLIFTSISLLATAILAYYLVRIFVTRPFEKLLSTVRSWQHSQFSARTGLSVSDGEIGILGFEFDRTMDQLVRREESVNVLIRELIHRSKNQLTLLVSLANRLARGQKSIDGYRDALVERLLALSASQDLLMQNDGQAIELGKLIQTQIKSFDSEKHKRISSSGPAVMVSPENARSIGMAIHELGTNAAKYGALAGPRGSVTIAWKVLTGHTKFIELSWVESGGPPVKQPQSSGFGRTLIEKIVPLQLNGVTDVQYLPEGFYWIVRFSEKFNAASSAPPPSLINQTSTEPGLLDTVT